MKALGKERFFSAYASYFRSGTPHLGKVDSFRMRSSAPKICCAAAILQKHDECRA